MRQRCCLDDPPPSLIPKWELEGEPAAFTKLCCIQTPKPSMPFQQLAISTLLISKMWDEGAFRRLQGWFVRWISNVELLGYYRYVNFMFYFLYFYLPTNTKIHSKWAGGYSIIHAAPHHSLLSPLNKWRGLHCHPHPHPPHLFSNWVPGDFITHYPFHLSNEHEGSSQPTSVML